MNKLVRRIATATAALAVAGGALFAAGGSATAAAPPPDARVTARSGVAVGTGTTGVHHGGYAGDGSDDYGRQSSRWDTLVWNRAMCDRFYPWIWDQLQTFGYVSRLSPQDFTKRN
ncbi:hypothetical protein [Streptomyces gibsoniae]|uniref:Uncharacterized protein n=1 Tax=Streptomyces gibsoniae TaxID=3075529 RepID=A0ABU2U220_9ACTN|nr:hypothetical protein [Streptomyces sp. DSM 41699]MDT0467269.1 hypothetical protein [Streptomyces sp. DSM 41699]